MNIQTKPNRLACGCEGSHHLVGAGFKAGDRERSRGRESYRELWLKLLGCLTVQAEAAPHDRGYPRRRDRF
jgi:hypothetical protein